MRRVKITGGPLARDIRIVDTETGADITSLVNRMELSGPTPSETGEGLELLSVKLTMFAEMDLEAEVVE